MFTGNEPILIHSVGCRRDRNGRLLIYTNQPGIAVEFIARVLRNGKGTWIMRRRTTAEIDELVCVSVSGK